MTYCIGQSYDIEINVSGKYKLLQTLSNDKCPFADYIPFAPSLNLVEKFAAKCCVKAVPFSYLY